LIRGLAIRTMSYIEVDKIIEAMAAPLRKCLKVNFIFFICILIFLFSNFIY